MWPPSTEPEACGLIGWDVIVEPLTTLLAGELVTALIT